MTLMPMLLALGVVAGPAHAKKGDAGVRLKYSTDLMKLRIDKVEYDGTVDDNSEQRYTTVSLLDSGGRFEATKMLGDGIEVGGIFGFTQERGTIGDTEDPTDRHVRLIATGAYNLGLGGGTRLFIQPLAGIDQATVDVGESTELQVRYLLAGADVGLRIKLNKKTTFDVAGEALMGNGKVTVDGQSDDKLKLKHTEAGLRIGISCRI